MSVKPKKQIIAVSGSRSIADSERVFAILDEEAARLMCLGYELEFHLGDAHGVDALAVSWARCRRVKHTIYYASKPKYDARVALDDQRGLEFHVLSSDWDHDGKQAGAMRNSDMISGGSNEPRADLLIAIWDGESRGTRHAILQARNSGIFVRRYGSDAPVNFLTPRPSDNELIEYHGEGVGA